MNEKTTTICVTIVICIFCIMFFGTFMVMSAADTKVTFSIEMDSNTKEFLEENNYCIKQQSTGEVMTTFLGNCDYLNETLVKVSQ